MPDPISSRPTPWRTILLVCGKCSRKLDGGFGPKRRQDLRRVLRGELKEAGHGRSIRVIETRCMGLCPKNAVTAMDAGHPGALLAIPSGTSPAVALDRLGISPLPGPAAEGK